MGRRSASRGTAPSASGAGAAAFARFVPSVGEGGSRIGCKALESALRTPSQREPLSWGARSAWGPAYARRWRLPVRSAPETRHVSQTRAGQSASRLNAPSAMTPGSDSSDRHDDLIGHGGGGTSPSRQSASKPNPRSAASQSPEPIRRNARMMNAAKTRTSTAKTPVSTERYWTGSGEKAKGLAIHASA